MIYLDNCATTEVDIDVADSAYKMMTECYGNASSPYGYQVAQVIAAPTERVFFTSGGTEANNLAIQGSLGTFATKGKIITTSIEHSSVLDACKYMGLQGYEVVFVSPRNGKIEAKDIIDQVDKDTRLVSVMAVNNETGEILPVKEISYGVKKKESKGIFSL